MVLSETILIPKKILEQNLGEIIDTRTNWLDTNQLEQVRGQVPLVYVDAVPVRVNELGVVTHVGMLLRQPPTVLFREPWFRVEFC